MSKPTHVFVTAAPGRLCPIAPGDATGPGGVLLKCEPGTVYRLPYSSYVRRRINAGDLILVHRDGKPAQLSMAAAPDAFELDDPPPAPPAAFAFTKTTKEG